MNPRAPMPRTRKREPAKNVIAALHAAHWAILPESLQQMMEIAARSLDEPITTLEQLEAKIGKPISDTGLMTLRDGVATIPVSGPLFRYANLFTMISGATSYETLAADLQQALDNSQVRAIILLIDSPGGEVNGNAELSQMVYDARGKKPIAAYVSHMGASAAYWLASSAGEVVVDSTSIIGSIGTVLSIADRTAADAARGVKTIEIVSSQSPKKRMPATSTEGQAALQTIVDDIASVFVDAVARNRGVSVDTVLSDFGQGGVFVGAAAVEQGLADRLGSYEQLHAQMASGRYAPPTRAVAQGDDTTSQEQDMPVNAADTTPKTQAAASTPPATAAAVPTAPAEPATPPATPPNPADPAAADTSAAVPDATGAETVVEAAATAERERITGIEALGRPGEEQLVAACQADPKCTVAEAALRLRRADGSAGKKRLQSLAADETNLEAPGPNGPMQTEVRPADAEARRILAAHTKVTTPNRS